MRSREPAPRVDDAEAVAAVRRPVGGHLRAGVVALQRAVGNRAVARWATELHGGGPDDLLGALTPEAVGLAPARPQGPDQRFIAGEGDSDAISPNDVRQGDVGDCWLMAALAAVARANPDVIRSMIEDRGGGVYYVTLPDVGGVPLVFNWDENGQIRPRTRTVRVALADIPMRRGGPRYAGYGDRDRQGNPELWVMIIERAVAQTVGGYSQMEGDRSGGGLARVTGRPSTRLELTQSDHAVQAALVNALDGGYAVVATTPDAPLPAVAPGVAPEGWLQRDHAYAVLNVSSEWVALQNPNFSGTVLLPIPTFSLLFESCSVSGAPLRPQAPSSGPRPVEIR